MTSLSSKNIFLSIGISIRRFEYIPGMGMGTLLTSGLSNT